MSTEYASWVCEGESGTPELLIKKCSEISHMFTGISVGQKGVKQVAGLIKEHLSCGQNCYLRCCGNNSIAAGVKAAALASRDIGEPLFATPEFVIGKDSEGREHTLIVLRISRPHG